MIKKLNEAEIEDLLRQNFIGRLGCHANGQTYIVPLSYAYDSGFIYVRAFEGLKIKMMRENPGICFQVDDMNNMSNWKSVIAWGKFEELTDVEQRNKALKILMERKFPPSPTSKLAKLSNSWPFAKSDYDDIPGVVFRIFLTEKTGRFERDDTSYAFVA